MQAPVQQQVYPHDNLYEESPLVETITYERITEFTTPDQQQIESPAQQQIPEDNNERLTLEGANEE